MIEEGRAVLEHCMKIEQQYQAQARHQRNHVAELARQLVAIVSNDVIMITMCWLY